MGMAEKAAFLNGIEKRMAAVLTAEARDQALKTVSDALEEYDMIRTVAYSSESDDLLETYLDALRIEGRSEKTIERYRYVISRMMKEVSVQTRQLTVFHIRNYLAKEKARGISDSTLEGHRQVFTAYFNWLQRETLIERNPTANLGAIKRQKKQKKIYSPVEIEKLNNACESLRDRAIIAFLRSTGCRISEMTGLDRGSVDMQKGECTVLGKGNKERTVYLDPVACMVLEEYLKSRKDDIPAMFIGKRGERLLPDGVRTMLKVLAKKAGLTNVHPHKFRRTLATNLIRHGMQLQEVANILGHDKLDTTMQYVVMNQEDLKNAYRRFYV